MSNMAPCSSSGSEDAIVIDRDDISNYNPAQILPEEPKVIEKIREWLKPTDYLLDSGEYHKHLASHMPGTGAWLTSSETYREWLNGEEHGLLWIKGIPGSGKSVVAAHIIDELSRAHPGIPILYFFFRQIIDANHEPVALLRDWLDQILMYSPPLQKALKEIWKGDRTISSLSMEDLWKHLRLGLSGLQGKAFCVADALDEMDQGNDEFLKSLAVLGQWWPEKVKVLMTSRLVPSIEIPLRRKKALHIRLDETEVDVDISSYVAHGLNSSTIAADDRELIREAIPGRANGLFLYAKLAMDAFLKPGAHAKTVLEALPADLHEMYTNLLHEHSQRSGVPAGIQLFILQWVTHAARPLRLLEVAEILNVAYRPEDERDLKATKDLVRAAAGPLLEILPDETVSVIHHSFTEYLKCTTRLEDDGGYTILRLGSTNGRLALACLTYLQSGCLDGIKVTEHPDDLDPEIAHGRLTRYGNFHGRDHKKGWQEKQQLRLKHPFLTYAVSNWHIHVAKSMAAGFPQDDINRAIGQFLNNDHRMKAWLKLQEECDYKGVTRLHVAARHGLTDYAGTLIIEQADVHAVDEFGRTPIAYAAKGGHADVIRLLVKAGADPDVDDEVGGLKPLHEAASENHSEAVRALLEAGVSPLTGKTCENPGRTCGNAPRSRGHTPLMYACDHGHLEALEAFLPFLKNIEIVHRALAWSSRSSRAKLVERILRHPGVDVNAK
ncbi:ankyrin [Byssothecium circinans]|uniref:Ankyrin n=1 Tax=Byssothecium circinans TaxID=147558 RepID=A0A6A5UFW9_9PLEO|nr:ankyrin [Byssothecium circinans]